MKLLLMLAGFWGMVLAADPSNLIGLGYHQNLGGAIPANAILRDEQGKSLELSNLLNGPPLILAPVYYHCPNLCGLVMGDLMAALQESGLKPGRDYRLVVFSIDPHDKPADAIAAKRQHLAEFPMAEAAENWHFLTGDSATLPKLENSIGFVARYDKQLQQYIHPAGVVIITPQGRIASYLLGVGYRPGDIRLGLLHARQDVIAEPGSPILLLCFHYNPATGRYSLAIMNLLRLMAVLTMITLGGTIYLAGRRR